MKASTVNGSELFCVCDFHEGEKALGIADDVRLLGLAGNRRGILLYWQRSALASNSILLPDQSKKTRMDLKSSLKPSAQLRAAELYFWNIQLPTTASS